MKPLAHNRRTFLKTTALTTLGVSVYGADALSKQAAGTRVGIIGLDTSHSVAFTKVLNAENPDAAYRGYRVVAAYPQGSLDIESSVKRIPGYIEEVKKLQVEIVDSIEELLTRVDVVLLETNDGRRHLEQALPVLKAGKRLFVDKPIAGSLTDAVKLFEASERYKVPLFSASSLRYIKGIETLDKSKVVGADTYSPAVLEKTHPDLFWYGVHGVETLFTVMGTGCQSVVRVHADSTDIVIGTWKDGRVGTFRGTRTGKHDYGGTVYTQNGNLTLGPYGGYEPLLKEIITFFDTGKVPVSSAETLEIFAFMEAADESKRRGGARVTLEEVMQKARKM
ncbi:Gfo/Idh/MocA family protein [Arundinibacter roseus]|uniref:Gfo/Idh/MocA family oxidoreductase n=1 Tax=Arundinibacter roseus TaxID=2070510 RepID=A0A4R4KE66_9BACT|nr:Gfo/Idh/MocA family oxidoreductase [Arundinibacter roseus]TDB65052.1 gfo/Idh/MocA family oxidoreductase [Arundinibacter roseus]